MSCAGALSDPSSARGAGGGASAFAPALEAQVPDRLEAVLVPLGDVLEFHAGHSAQPFCVPRAAPAMAPTERDELPAPGLIADPCSSEAGHRPYRPMAASVIASIPARPAVSSSLSWYRAASSAGAV